MSFATLESVCCRIYRRDIIVQEYYAGYFVTGEDPN